MFDFFFFHFEILVVIHFLKQLELCPHINDKSSPFANQALRMNRATHQFDELFANA